MKTFITLFALVASFACAERTHQSTKPKKVVFVIATNADPAIGTVVATTLDDAKAEISDLAGLDPVCWILPQVCAARAAATMYTLFYSDGTKSAVYNP